MGFCEMGFCEMGFIDVSPNHVIDTIVIISFHDVLSFDMHGLFWFVVYGSSPPKYENSISGSVLGAKSNSEGLRCMR